MKAAADRRLPIIVDSVPLDLGFLSIKDHVAAVQQSPPFPLLLKEVTHRHVPMRTNRRVTGRCLAHYRVTVMTNCIRLIVDNHHTFTYCFDLSE